MNLETFFEKFELFADAPDAVEKMRELVLELAVRGKLVAPLQNPDEHPAWLAFRKEISERVYSYDPGPPPPFEIPHHWEWCVLDEVADCRASAKVSPASIADTDWVLDLEDIDGTKGQIIQTASFAERRSLSTKAAFETGDVLYGKLRPYLNKVVVASKPGFCTTEIIPLRPATFLSSEFLRFYLRSQTFLRYAAQKNYGMKMPRLGTKDLESAEIPVPPPAEQKRIVAKVDELMALCDQLEAQQREREQQHTQLARASLDRFTQAPSVDNLNFIFHNSYDITPAELRKTILTLAVRGKLVPQDPNDEPAEEVFDRLNAQKELRIAAKEMRRSRELQIREGSDDLSDFPQTWKSCRLGEVGNATDSAIVDGPFGQSIDVKSDYVTEGVPVIRMTNVKPFEFIERNLKFIRPEKFASLRRHNVVPGDVLLGKVGSIGLCALYPESMPEGMLSTTGLCRFRVGELVEPRFLCIFLNSIADYLRSIASEAVQPFLNMKTINSIAIPVPPLAEQHRIVAKVEQLMKLVDELEAQISASRASVVKLLDAVIAQLTEVE